jgi:hypothetical protein
MYWYVSLEADGVIKFISVLAPVGKVDVIKITPSYYARVVVKGVVLAEWLRRWVARSDVEFVLDGEFKRDGAHIVIVDPHLHDEFDDVPWERASLGPYSIGQRATLETTVDLIERELWDAFGLRRRSSIDLDLDKVFQTVGL